MAVQTFTSAGSKAAAATLPKSIFGEEIKSHELLHQAFVTHHSALRSNTAQTLTRGEVRGGGRKPWRQKGTGRARHGSIRSPIWRGGGVTFGPSTDRNYTKRLTATAKRKAIRQALTLSAKDGSLSIIEDFASKDGKTKTAATLLKKLGLPTPILLIVDKKSTELERATRNIADLDMVSARYLSVYRISNAAHVLVTKAAIKTLEEWLSGGTSKEAKA